MAGDDMIVETRKITIERRLSDYCKGCEYFTPEQQEWPSWECGTVTHNIIETCRNCNLCDSLYRRLKL